ncbi:unnamed protein product [Caenorhabditis angaria]|uniref:7TM GPCR serpentine receptor class x (Srx) domain-containing protein n=1 Tax=Caenorhabditis angaria TaxID=860376 RepID=A0A9P1IWV8_9PELO|nr:unnamed protein product [Caenorhabditis angaria]
MLLRLLLGFLIFLFSAIGILVNLIVLQPVYKLSKNLNKSSVYLISFFNILTDLVNLSQSAFYLAPCIIFKSYIFGEKNDEGIPKLLGTLALVTWYIGNITQIVMATNRFVVICYLNNNIFTHRNIKILFGITLIFAITKAYIVQYITPCCAFVYDYQILSYNYARKPGIPNYSDISDLPLNAFATIVAFTCYILVSYFRRNCDL